MIATIQVAVLLLAFLAPGCSGGPESSDGPDGARSDEASTHFDVRSLAVPFTGEPWYIEFAPAPDDGARNGVVGTPVSDYGSHFGIKANLWEHRPLYLANYATVPGLSGKLDRSVFDVLEADGRPVELERRIEFAPWGWSENARGPGVSVSGSVATIDTDTFLLALTIESSRSVAVRLRVFADTNSRAIHEGSVPLAPGDGDARLDHARNELVVRRSAGDQTIHGLLTSLTNAYRIYRLSFPVASTSFSPGFPDYSFDVVSEPLSGTTTLTAVLGIGLSERSARSRADAGAARLGGDPASALEAIDSDWRGFFDAQPPLPAAAGPTERRLYRLASAALRMNLVAPRAAMTGWGSVPSKAHFNFFFGWDTPLQAIGYAEWHGWTPPWIDQGKYTLAQQMLLLQLASALPNGQICISHDDSLACPLPLTQPPLQAWAAWEVARRDPDSARADRFLAAAYDGLARFFDFWFLFRDADLDRLPEYRVGLEYGWDDTPRYTGRDHEEAEAFLPTLPVEPVELASWLALYAGSMARISERLGRPAEAGRWCDEAQAMAARIESAMWDERRGAWMDRIAFGLGVVDVRTPAMWWPAFADAVTVRSHATRAVERHLLDPRAFFGRYPIPTVAYDDPLYDHAQDGYYWQGQIWLVPAYASLVALARTGHPGDARVLLERLIAMMGRTGGIFEAYDALTGEVGWGATGGAGVEPSAFQFGWSSALISQALLGRYQDVAGALDCTLPGP